MYREPLFDKDDFQNLLAWLFWAALFGLLAWAAWLGVTATVWWGKPAGLSAGILSLWIVVAVIRKAWNA